MLISAADYCVFFVILVATLRHTKAGRRNVGDMYEGGYMAMPQNLCPKRGSRLRALVMVSSAASNSRLREGVRATWGEQVKRRNMALAFVLGNKPADPDLTNAVHSEAATYDDIIVGNFEENYSNLTLKILSMLEWVNAYCPRVRFIVKSDDDMLVNVPRLILFLKYSAKRKANNTMWGKVMKKVRPTYKTYERYHISKSEYSKYYYPTFISGPLYIMTSDVISNLVSLAKTENYIWLEDVFFTGILAEGLGIRRVNVPNIILLEDDIARITVNDLNKYMAVHLKGRPLHREMWAGKNIIYVVKT